MRYTTGHMRYARRPKPYPLRSTLNTVIFGYYGGGNLGDEANLGELVAFLREIQPAMGITVISASPESTAGCFGVASTGKYDWAGIVKVFRKADLLIGGGGSLFQDRSSLRSLMYYAGLIFLARRRGIPVFLYGQGIGPLSTKAAKLLARPALSYAAIIAVRDRLSQKLLAELKVGGPAIHLTADPLLMKKRIPEPDVKRYWEGIPTQAGFKLGLVPLEFHDFNLHFWTRVLDALRQRVPGIYLITTARDDWRLQYSLANNFGIPVLPVEDSWEMLQMAAGGLDLVVSARLHGLVAAVVQGTPCYGLALDPKIDGFCISLGIGYYGLPDGTAPFSLSQAILNHVKQGAIAKETLQRLSYSRRDEAIRNQTLLRQFIHSIRGREKV